MVKRVIAVQDLSGLGKCSLTAVIPVLSVMGLQVCPLPTAVLSNQTGFPSYFLDDYTAKIDRFIEEWKKCDLTADGIFTGFLASESQVDEVLKVLSAFKKDDTLVVVDPVMGDGGKIYPTFSPAFCEKMKELTQRADVITPNLTEACLLSGEDYEKIITLSGDDLKDAVFSLCERLSDGNKTVVITGCPEIIDGEKHLLNFGTQKGKRCCAKSRYYGGSFSGTGDLFASVICAHLVKGGSLEQALNKATAFIEKATKESDREGVNRAHGVDFEPLLYTLVD